MAVRLGPKQTAALFTLMATARELSNPQLEELVGFRLYGKELKLLKDEGLVKSRSGKRNTLVHELTDRGWAWCTEELRAEAPPNSRSTLVPAMYVILGCLEDYLRRTNQRLADIFAPATTSRPEPVDVETRIRTAYRELARNPRDWVGLVDLRPKLGDVPKKELDAVLKELSRNGQAHLVPESNRKALGAADHAAAVRIGGEDNHLIRIEA